MGFVVTVFVLATMVAFSGCSRGDKSAVKGAGGGTPPVVSRERVWT